MKLEFELNNDLYNRFSELLTEKDKIDTILSKKIKEYIIDNVKVDMNSLYTCKFIDTEHYKIENTVKENGKLFILLNDGSKIDYFIFEQLYEKTVDPQKFFESSVNLTSKDVEEGKNIIYNADPGMGLVDLLKKTGFKHESIDSYDNQSDTSLGKISPKMIVVEKDKS